MPPSQNMPPPQNMPSKRKPADRGDGDRPGKKPRRGGRDDDVTGEMIAARVERDDVTDEKMAARLERDDVTDEKMAARLDRQNEDSYELITGDLEHAQLGVTNIAKLTLQFREKATGKTRGVPTLFPNPAVRVCVYHPR